LLDVAASLTAISVGIICAVNWLVPLTEDFHLHVAVNEIVLTPLQPAITLPFALNVTFPATLETAEIVMACLEATVRALPATLNEILVRSGTEFK
jgi:hypothetical protein